MRRLLSIIGGTAASIVVLMVLGFTVAPVLLLIMTSIAGTVWVAASAGWGPIDSWWPPVQERFEQRLVVELDRQEWSRVADLVDFPVLKVCAFTPYAYRISPTLGQAAPLITWGVEDRYWTLSFVEAGGGVHHRRISRRVGDPQGWSCSGPDAVLIRDLTIPGRGMAPVRFAYTTSVELSR